MAHNSLFEEVITRSDPQSSEFALPDVADREYIVVERGATAAEYAKDKCVHELFAEQAAKTPYAVALIYEDQKLSYGELDRRSNQLAHHLRGAWCRPRDGGRAVHGSARSIWLSDFWGY